MNKFYKTLLNVVARNYLYRYFGKAISFCKLFFLILTFSAFTAKAQLYIGSSAAIYIRNTNGGALSAYDNTNAGIALFIDSSFTNNGIYDNGSGEMQLTGSITNTGTFTTTGDEVFVSKPSAIITTSINQRITGNFIGTNNFYNLITQKLATQFVELANNTNVENLIKFNNSGRIRTDIQGHTNDGSAYPNEIYLENGNITSLVGNSAGNGATEKYIEGKLRRNATEIGSFYFPIGVAPTSLDGMEAYELNFTANPNMDFLSYIKPAIVNPITRNVLCDIGKDPGAGIDPFSNCVGKPDGIYDWYFLEVPMDLSHEWIAKPSGATTGYNYGITLHPGNILDWKNSPNLYYTIPAGCGIPYQAQRIRVIAKDGIVGGNLQVGPGNWAPFQSLSSYIWCQFDDASLDISLNSQTSFSTYRIHGTNLNSNTILPVELINLNAKPINNEFIKVSWATASELNNLGFEVLRSTDAINFTSVGFLNGNVTTNQKHNYSFDDHDVQAGMVYYYKLKQIDFNGNFKFTYIVNAKLNSISGITISDIYPNPITTESFVNIFTSNPISLSYSIYNPIGQEISTKNIQLNTGNNKIALTNYNLADGIYLVRFNYDNSVITRKIIK